MPVIVMMVVVVIVMVHRASPQAVMLALRHAPAKAQSSDTASVSFRPAHATVRRGARASRSLKTCMHLYARRLNLVSCRSTFDEA
jgi:hypothetical protein